jgi:hypothetical protein
MDLPPAGDTSQLFIKKLFLLSMMSNVYRSFVISAMHASTFECVSSDLWRSANVWVEMMTKIRN